MRKIRFIATAISAATLLAACGGGDDPVVAPVAPAPEEKRAHDTRVFTADATATTFDAMAAAAGDTVDMGSTRSQRGLLPAVFAASDTGAQPATL